MNLHTYFPQFLADCDEIQQRKPPSTAIEQLLIFVKIGEAIVTTDVEHKRIFTRTFHIS
jgi:hypothetical protein